LRDASPRNTPLPPGEPSGGVVYLRIVLSPEEASCLQVFLNMNVLEGGFVSTSPNPQAGGPPLVGCPRYAVVTGTHYTWHLSSTTVKNSNLYIWDCPASA